jgi:hypothetical protein
MRIRYRGCSGGAVKGSRNFRHGIVDR